MSDILVNWLEAVEKLIKEWREGQYTPEETVNKILSMIK